MMGSSQPITKFKPGFFRIIINAIWGIVFLFFGLMMAVMAIPLILDQNWIFGFGMLLIGPALLYYAIVNYFIGSFTSYLVFDGDIIEFRNVKTIHKVPLSQLRNIQWVKRKGKLQSITLELQNSTPVTFDAEIYSGGDKKQLIEFNRGFNSPTPSTRSSLDELTQAKNQITPRFCDDCGYDVTSLKFCQNCGKKVLV